jgi:hypothetical protein
MNQEISINVGLGSGLIGSAANLFVDASGSYWRRQGITNGFRTIQKAVTASRPGTVIFIAPGDYDEAVTIPRTHGGNLSLVAVGGRGSAAIAPSTTNAVALTNHADNVTIVGLGLAGNGTGAGLINTGSRLRVRESKIEGGDIGAQLTLGTVAQIAAGSKGKGADVLCRDCETAWTTTGVLLTASDYGAVTQVRFVDCLHHNHSAATFEESGGSVDIRYRNLNIEGSTFGQMEDGTIPTKFISLNDDNGNKGLVTRCTFPVAINSGKNLVSTGLLWVSNYHTGGVSTAQPS